jgi:hypothetical protein
MWCSTWPFARCAYATVRERPRALDSGGSLRSSALPVVAPAVLASPAVVDRPAPFSPTPLV